MFVKYFNRIFPISLDNIFGQYLWVLQIGFFRDLAGVNILCFSLSGLQTLECRENLVQSLPISLCNIKSLEQLDLGANELDDLPDEIEKFQNLHDLWLDGNNLLVIPEVCYRLLLPCRVTNYLSPLNANIFGSCLFVLRIVMWNANNSH